MSTYGETPLVFILGAGRSGTNLLTFAFDAESPDFGNLGENRYIWTVGQNDTSSDRRTAEEVTPRIRRYLHRHFAMRAQRFEGASGKPATVFLDKTPSNAFRLPFAAEVFPEAKFIHIIRDGRDNLLSRSRQWKALKPQDASVEVPMQQAAGKLRFLSERSAELRRLIRNGALPVDRFPAIFSEVARRKLLPLLKNRSVMYGERVPGLDRILAKEGVDAAASVQWCASVMTAHRDGAVLGPERYHELRYEDFISRPREEWQKIIAFLGRTPTGAGDAWLAENIMAKNSRKWLDPEEAARIARVEDHLRPTLEELGYGWDMPDVAPEAAQ